LFIFEPARNAVLLVAGDKVRPMAGVVRAVDSGSGTGVRGLSTGTAMSEKPEFFTYTRDDFLDEFVHSDDRAAVEEARQKRTLQVRAEYLTEMRKKAAMTQAEVASAMGVSQQRVSAIESGSVAELSTLADYIRTLGGELKVIADFGDSWCRVA
jgi:DNA-binding XRE family transcriptional regulator